MTDHDRYYDIFRTKDTRFDAQLFMAVKTTGIFCRPGCPARLPKPENCEFYDTAHAALDAGYRACKRCHPHRPPGEATTLVKELIGWVETDPERRWSEDDLKAHGIDPSTARRQFRARFGMSFLQYARARRMGYASQALSQGGTIMEAQVSIGYESASGFRSAFAKAFGASPKTQAAPPLFIEWIDTPLGPMVAVCDHAALFLLEFTDRKHIDRQMQRIAQKNARHIIPGRTEITDQIEGEIGAYFNGTLKQFETPCVTTGTDFQKQVWAALMTIPYGEVWSYSDLAVNVGNDKAVRAVASSNANNGLAIIIPCHRVIAKDGGLGGYAGGLERKDWLLRHEGG